MIELFRTLSHWIVGFADSPWAVAILVINSFTESIFNPFPPDPLLIGMALLNPSSAFLFAALVTVSSVHIQAIATIAGLPSEDWPPASLF